MKPRQIILLRHGESEANISKALYENKQDHMMDLTAKGEQQCIERGIAFRSSLKGKKITVWSSPYKRSRRTSQIVFSQLTDSEIRFKEDPRIREQEWGNFYTVDEALRKKEERQRHSYFFYRIEGGESGADVYDRISTFLESLYRDFKDDEWTEVLVISTHGITALLFLMRFFHWPYEEYECAKRFGNCEYVTLDLNLETGKYVMGEDNRSVD
jgi:broad specificity phosphatase PhoE